MLELEEEVRIIHTGWLGRIKERTYMNSTGITTYKIELYAGGHITVMDEQVEPTKWR